MTRKRLTIAGLTLAVTFGIAGLVSPTPEASAAAFNKPTNSSPITISADNTLVWSVSTGDNSVAVIRTDTNVKIASIALGAGREPRSVAVDPNNQFAYVANAAKSTVTVIKITNPSPLNFQAAIDTTVGVNGEITTGASLGTL